MTGHCESGLLVLYYSVLPFRCVVGDCGRLDAVAAPSPELMMSWIEASSASTRLDICITAEAKRMSSQVDIQCHGRGPIERGLRLTSIEDLGGHILKFRIELLQEVLDLRVGSKTHDHNVRSATFVPAKDADDLQKQSAHVD